MSALVILLLSFKTEDDKVKFEVIFSDYKNLMLHKAYGILHDYMLAEDAVSEALLRVYKNLDKVEDVHAPRAIAFVVTITKNCALTLLQKHAKNTVVPLDEQDADNFDLEERVISDLSSGEILLLVNELGEDQKSVFLLKYAYDMSHKAIGKALQMSENNVTVRLHRARKKLGALLVEKGYSYER